MIGHQQVIACRKAGFKPAVIFVDDRPIPRWLPPDSDLPDGAPNVYVGGDRPQFADMRFVVGCRVCLHADDSERAFDWIDRLLADGAVEVIRAHKGEVSVWRP